MKIICGGFFLITLLLAGCTNTAVFDYSAAPGTLGVFKARGEARKTVAVMPFLDQRTVNQLTGPAVTEDTDGFYWGFLPLVPCGFTEKDEPEKGEDFVSLGRFHFDPANDLAQAAFTSLKASNLFRSVTRANTLEQAQTDYVFRGRLTGTHYSGKIYAYFITYFLSPALWIIGAPSGSSTCRLGVAFELTERATGKIIWSYTFDEEAYLFHWIYARTGKDTSLYAGLMKQAMNAALFNLNEKVPAL